MPTAPVPKPPATIFTTERFIASAISLVKMPPDAPTSAPAMVNVAFCRTKPAMATAVPVNALSSEITTGMSAPPMGSTMSTPKPRAAITTISKIGRLCAPAMTAMPDPTATRNSAAEISRPPGGEIEPLQYPCNLAAASSEPENVMPPISTSRTVAVAVPADTRGS